MCVRARNTTKTLVPVAAGLLLLTAVVPVAAQSASANFTVSGNSTIRGWSCKAPGTVQFKQGAGAPALPGLKGGVEVGTLTVKVLELTCPEEEMTGHLRDAMKPDQNATITFELKEYALAGGSAEAKGNLTINGVTKAVTLPVKLQAAQSGGVRLEGETSIDMREYKVEPPTVFFGALTVRPVIRVHFDTTLR